MPGAEGELRRYERGSPASNPSMEYVAVNVLIAALSSPSVIPAAGLHSTCPGQLSERAVSSSSDALYGTDVSVRRRIQSGTRRTALMLRRS